MPGHKTRNDYSPNEFLKVSLNVKKNQISKDLCFGNSKDLCVFYKEVFSYRFKQIPNYEILRSFLRDIRDKERSFKQENVFKKLDLSDNDE